MFRLAVLALTAASASAFTSGFHPDSVQARKLLKESTLLEGRGLGGGGNNNNNNYNNHLYYVMGALSLKYTGCSNIYSLGGGQGGNNNNNKNGNNQNSIFYNSAVVTYELRESCDGTLVGKYATNMVAFVDSYTEAVMDEQEWLCENYREEVCQDLCQNYGNNNNNNNNNGNNNGMTRDQCYYGCFMDSVTNSGQDLTACAKYYSGEEAQQFEVQRYLQCGQLKANNNGGNNNNNNNNNNNAYQVDSSSAYAAYPAWDGVYRSGAYCAADGYSILLGVFYDQQCAVRAPESVYSSMNNGATLPYTSTSLVPKGSCLSCVDAEKQYQNQQKQNNNNNNNNNQNANNQNWNNMEPKQFCLNAYQQAVKCENEESGHFDYGAITTGCDFMFNYLPKLAPRVESSTSSSSAAVSEANPSVVLAWMFAMTTVLLGAYAYFLVVKIKRTAASGLSSQDGTLA